MQWLENNAFVRVDVGRHHAHLVGDHILHICQVDKFLGDEDKKGLYAWNGFGKVAPAVEG